MENKLFKIFVINYYGNLPKILEQLDIEVQHNGLMFCPMHDNFNTPAAKLFKDKTGWHFYCFNEQKQFGTYDVYKQVFNYNMNQVFNQLWSSLKDDDKQHMIDIFGEYDTDTIPENFEIYKQFSQGKINYKTLKEKLVTASNESLETSV